MTLIICRLITGCILRIWVLQSTRFYSMLYLMKFYQFIILVLVFYCAIIPPVYFHAVIATAVEFIGKDSIYPCSPECSHRYGRGTSSAETHFDGSRTVMQLLRLTSSAHLIRAPTRTHATCLSQSPSPTVCACVSVYFCTNISLKKIRDPKNIYLHRCLRPCF